MNYDDHLALFPTESSQPVAPTKEKGAKPKAEKAPTKAQMKKMEQENNFEETAVERAQMIKRIVGLWASKSNRAILETRMPKLKISYADLEKHDLDKLQGLWDAMEFHCSTTVSIRWVNHGVDFFTKTLESVFNPNLAGYSKAVSENPSVESLCDLLSAKYCMNMTSSPEVALPLVLTQTAVSVWKMNRQSEPFRENDFEQQAGEQGTAEKKTGKDSFGPIDWSVLDNEK
jgi:hypothetical protein